jgi:hypothetical protein
VGREGGGGYDRNSSKS